MVFPVGMYAVAAIDLGRTEHLSIFDDIGAGGLWVALAVYIINFG